MLGDRIRIRMFLGLPDLDPLFRGMDPSPLVRGTDLRIRIRNQNVTDPQHWLPVPGTSFLFQMFALSFFVRLGCRVKVSSDFSARKSTQVTVRACLRVSRLQPGKFYLYFSCFYFLFCFEQLYGRSPYGEVAPKGLNF